MHGSSLHSLWGESQLRGGGGGVSIHRLEIRFWWTKRTTFVTTASLWMARGSAGSWNVLKTVLGSQSTLLASCYTSPQGSSSFDAGQETCRRCRKCVARLPTAAHWSLGKTLGQSKRSEWLQRVDGTLVIKLSGIAVSSETCLLAHSAVCTE